MSLMELRSFAVTVLVGAVGALIAILIGFPAPYLIGPAVVISVAGLLGMKLSVPDAVRNACFVIVGISMGATVTPEVIVAARTWPLSFVMVFVAIIVLLFSSCWVLQRFFGYDRVTALLASSPGHLSYVLSLAAETRCDVRTVSVAQSVRVLALTITTPLIVSYLGLSAVGTFSPGAQMSVPVFVATLAASLLAGFLFLRWNFPAALLLGGVVVSIGIHITGFVHGGPPDWLMTPTYIILGTVIGTRFSGVSIREVWRAFLSGLVVTAVVSTQAAAIAFGVSYFLGVPLDAALIAFAPGGLETMAAMAVMLNANPTYVGAHHVLRLLILSVLMPFLMGKEARQR